MNNWSSQPPGAYGGPPYPGYPTGGMSSMPMPDFERTQYNPSMEAPQPGVYPSLPGQQQPYPPQSSGYPLAGQSYPTSPAQNPSYPYPSQPHGNQSWPAYPSPNQPTSGYPGQSAQPAGYHSHPSHAPSYPAHPPQAPGYPSNPPQVPGYPANPPHVPGYSAHPPQVPGYPANPPQVPGYPAYPPQPSGYPASQRLSYPAQPSAPSAPYAPQPSYGAVSAGYPVAPVPVGVCFPGQVPVAGGLVTVTYPPDEPTIRPRGMYNAEADCKVLHKAMKGLGTDEKAIIEVLANRPLAHRLQLTVIYKTMYGKDLISQLKSELSGNFENAVVAMLQPAEFYDAHTLHDAIDRIGTNESALIEVIFTRTNAELHAIKIAYKFLFKEDLEHAIKSDTSGYFRRILVACLTGARQEGYQVDLAKAQADAKALYQAGPARWGTNEATFISIFASRSLAHLKVTFDEYKRFAHTDIENTVKSEMSGDVEDAFLAIARLVKSKHGYFAERLYKSMAGAGTKDKQLIRVIVSRSEKDLGSIKREFQRTYGKSLESYIADDCSGDYKKMLLAIVRQ